MYSIVRYITNYSVCSEAFPYAFGSDLQFCCNSPLQGSRDNNDACKGYTADCYDNNWQMRNGCGDFVPGLQIELEIFL